MQDKSSVISCTVTPLLYQRKAWPCCHEERTEPSSLLKQLRVPISITASRAFPALERDPQAAPGQQQGRLWHPGSSLTLCSPQGCSELLTQRSPGGCSGLYKLIKGLM